MGPRAFSLLWLFAALFLGILGCGSEPTTPEAAPAPVADKLKVAFVYVGPVGDGGWTTAHDLGRTALAASNPKVETLYLENVPEGAEASRAITQLAEKGAKLIFTTSFGFMEPTLDVAKRYPDVVFMHCSGYKRAENVGTYFGKMEQAEYLAGLVAGSMSKKGRLGYVAPHPIPEVIRFINAFTLGAREANPAATVRVVWTNAWFDPSREREAALAMLDAGADVIATGADSTAPLQAAEERGAYAVGYDSDGRSFAPKAFLTAPLWDWSVVYREVAQKVEAKTWTSGDWNGGLESGVIKLAPLSEAVPAEVRALVETRTAEIKAGTRDVFAGPLRRQDGTVAFAAGAAPSDEERLRMDWLVEGVEGQIPK